MSPFDFDDVCWLEGIFEKLLHDAKKAKNKDAVINLIRLGWQEIKEQKFGYINKSLGN